MCISTCAHVTRTRHLNFAQDLASIIAVACVRGDRCCAARRQRRSARALAHHGSWWKSGARVRCCICATHEGRHQGSIGAQAPAPAASSLAFFPLCDTAHAQFHMPKCCRQRTSLHTRHAWVGMRASHRRLSLVPPRPAACQLGQSPATPTLSVRIDQFPLTPDHVTGKQIHEQENSTAVCDHGTLLLFEAKTFPTYCELRKGQLDIREFLSRLGKIWCLGSRHDPRTLTTAEHRGNARHRHGSGLEGVY